SRASKTIIRDDTVEGPGVEVDRVATSGSSILADAYNLEVATPPRLKREVFSGLKCVSAVGSNPRFLNMEHYERLKGIGLLVATQMSESSEKLKNLSLYLLGAIFAVYAMELCVMPSRNVIISRIASNSTKLLSFYLLLCILKPDWLSSCRFVIVCIIAIACTCFDELNVTSQNASALYQYIKIKLTWCCEKSVMVISYVIDKVLTSRNDQASPASAPPHASV
ncbi:hypothetical protein Tco_1072661, partial [Tanacetum coccineum]